MDKTSIMDAANSCTSNFARTDFFSLIVFACFFWPLNTLASVTFSGDYLTTTSSSGAYVYHYIGNNGVGYLDIQNGGNLESANGYLGYRDGSYGEARISGAGSLWNAYSLTVGYIGTGVLNIQNGASVTSYKGSVHNGITTVNGLGSLWDIGHTLSVSNESVLKIINGGVVATKNGGGVGSGMAIIDGAESKWIGSNSTFNVGSSGSGEVIIQNGGMFSGVNVSLGAVGSDIGVITVSDIGSSLTSRDNLIIGNSNQNNIVNVINGGSAISKFTVIGGYYSANANGTLNVDGVGSRSDSSLYLFVGYRGNGALNISNGGTVTSQDGYIGRSAGSNGAVVVDGNGSSWSNSGSLFVGGYQSSSGTTSELTIKNGGQVSASDVTIWSMATMNLNDGILNTNTLNVEGSLTSNGVSEINGNIFVKSMGELTLNGGVLNTDTMNIRGGLTSNGLSNIRGNVNLADTSSVLFDIGGTLRGDEYDSFNVEGDLTLAGNLEIIFYELDLGDSSFEATIGDTFTLFSAENIAGEFDLLALSDLGNGLDLQLDYLIDFSGTTDYVQLSVVSSMPVPGAAWLFGSGLIGFIGLARRKNITIKY